MVTTEEVRMVVERCQNKDGWLLGDMIRMVAGGCQKGGRELSEGWQRAIRMVAESYDGRKMSRWWQRHGGREVSGGWQRDVVVTERCQDSGRDREMSEWWQSMIGPSLLGV